MSTVTGVVEAVSTKFGKFSVLVNDNWYGTKAEWTPKPAPSKGDTISFDSGPTGKYLKNVVITEGSSASHFGGGDAAPRPAGGSNLVGVAVGAAMNQATTLLAGKDVDLKVIEELACDLYDIAERLKKNAAAGNIREDAEAAENAMEALKREFADA